ncbi:MAG: 2-oxoacid:acceptor oxidoreductase family protein [bacterium]|uniref:Pyruvate:ferredoxin oxidoreductase gamma subunit n=2 Tax=Bacteria candidate phyla TaxID=1783234 RepID=A0A101I3E9_UNCT6|nr:MAG: Pyruvate:ferredoxin oxidoreductase gamma subunit [candidate division TA06 bacterium 32_111]KUK87508.1 MAG: Pyruvate:ferredoxin oxidoreductase gamma subunit [candidate division TA06 bacterium 34_109]MDI6700338.1 2-oxoacid:acceptor oxidoreductase family protein [bacterium]HAF08156.1 pyruvate synthase [candidate division WOR-3 bacterium]HCP16718.1 pyruvate synthase [candidate division WOR-3 bacterium]
MKDFFEIRWHGRGGQGAKTVALLFADSALATGKYIQAFPEYGPERMGAPVQSFNRLSDNKITIHSPIKNPDVVVVLDQSLMDTVDTTSGMEKGGIIIINTVKKPSEIREKYKINDSIKIFTVDASKISIEEIGVNKPNTPMFGALVKVTKILDFERMLKDTEEKMKKKFANKPEVVEGNIKAIKRAYEEVVSE